MNPYEAEIVGRLAITGTLECRDANGNLLKTIDLSGSIPLADAAHLEQAQKLIQEADRGSDNRP